MDIRGNLYRDLTEGQIKIMKKIQGDVTELTSDELREMEMTPKSKRVKALNKRRGTVGTPGAYGGKTKR